MTIVYIIPYLTTPESLKQMAEGFGCQLNPVMDADGQWIISEQEWYSDEFQSFREANPEIAAGFAPVQWKKPVINAGPPVK